MTTMTKSTRSDAMPLEQLHLRLQHLEQRFAENDLFSEDPSILESRIQKLEHWRLPSALTEDAAAIEQQWQEVSPGTALTHQRQIVAPMVYRRQEILAAADTYRSDLQLLLELRQLLSIGSTTSSEAVMTESHVVQAPILVQETTQFTPEEDQRMQAIGQAVSQLEQRVHHVSRHFDHLLNHYNTLILAISEKLVCIEEDISKNKSAS
jgi:hypothetical protein